MAMYTSVTGWLGCEHSQVEEIRKIISGCEFSTEFEYIMDYETRKFYNKGWCFQKEGINWTAYVFYGADIKDYCVDFIKTEIKEIAGKIDEVNGLFLFQHEEGEIICWKIVESNITEEKISAC